MKYGNEENNQMFVEHLSKVTFKFEECDYKFEELYNFLKDDNFPNDDYSISKEIFENKNKYSSQGMEKCRNNVIFTTLDSHSSSNEAILFCLRQLYKQMLDGQVNEKNNQILGEESKIYQSSNNVKENKNNNQNQDHKHNHRINTNENNYTKSSLKSLP